MSTRTSVYRTRTQADFNPNKAHLFGWITGRNRRERDAQAHAQELARIEALREAERLADQRLRDEQERLRLEQLQRQQQELLRQQQEAQRAPDTDLIAMVNRTFSTKTWLIIGVAVVVLLIFFKGKK